MLQWIYPLLVKKKRYLITIQISCIDYFQYSQKRSVISDRECINFPQALLHDILFKLSSSDN